MATWRLVQQQRPKGAYFVLQKGRARERVLLTLGYLPAEDAARAFERVQAEEDSGTIGRVLRLYKRGRSDAIHYLVGNAIVHELMGPAIQDYAGMTMREYYEHVYAEARAAAHPRGWPSEKRHWAKLLDSIGHNRLYQVDAFVLADHLDAMLVTRGKRKGEPVSGTTKRLHRAALQAMLKWAFRRKHIDKLPDLALFRIEGATKRVRDKPDPLNLVELVALLDACEDPKHRAMFAVGAGQGLRPSELVWLDWSDIDWSVPALQIRGTKTEASADTIPMTPLAQRELRKWWERCERPTSGMIFLSSSGKPYSDATGHREALATAAKRAGIQRRVYPYLLRDSFATIAWAVGIESLRVKVHAAVRTMSTTQVARALLPPWTEPRMEALNPCRVYGRSGARM